MTQNPPQGTRRQPAGPSPMGLCRALNLEVSGTKKNGNEAQSWKGLQGNKSWKSATAGITDGSDERQPESRN